MLNKICICSFLFLLLLCFQFCSLTQFKDESPKINIIKSGQKFKINLKEDHSNGYLWQLSENYNKELIQDLGAVWHGNKKGVDFNLKALSVGQTTLSFHLRKYQDTLNNKCFIVNIISN